MDMVEKVARAIWDASDIRSMGAWEAMEGAPKVACRRMARVAIEAMMDGLIDPPVAARNAGAETLNRLFGGSGATAGDQMAAIAVWQDMLRVAVPLSDQPRPAEEKA